LKIEVKKTLNLAKIKDWTVKQRLSLARRLAWELGETYNTPVNHKRVSRVMTNHESHWLRLTIEEAITVYGSPQIFHSDQGSEYSADPTLKLLKENKIKVSMSKKASPWENAYQERFYGGFKPELKYRIQTQMQDKTDAGELYEIVARQIHYYNHDRFHTSIKDKPARYRQKLLAKKEEKKVSSLLGG
jgi:putative transposase